MKVHFYCMKHLGAGRLSKMGAGGGVAISDHDQSLKPYLRSVDDIDFLIVMGGPQSQIEWKLSILILRQRSS